jgi:transposase-like protein
LPITELERDLAQPQQFFDLPHYLSGKQCTTNVIDRWVAEVQRTRQMVMFTDVQSVDRINYAIFSLFNQVWKNHTSVCLHTQLDARAPTFCA